MILDLTWVHGGAVENMVLIVNKVSHSVQVIRRIIIFACPGHTENFVKSCIQIK